MREYVRAHAEEIRAYKKEYAKKYRQTHPGYSAAASAKYRKTHLEDLRLKGRLAYHENPEKHIAQVQKWRQRNRARYLNYKLEYYLDNLDVIRSKSRDKRLRLLEMLGCICAMRGYCENVLALQIDHIFGDGHKDKVRFNGSGLAQYKYYLEHADEAKARLQVLCSNCNQIKRFENKELRIKYR
jgi:hypothetical protein